MDQYNSPFLKLINTIETWLACATLCVAFFWLLNVALHPNYYYEELHQNVPGYNHWVYGYINNLHMSYAVHHIWLLISYLVLRFIIVKNLVAKKAIAKNIALGCLLFLLTIAVLTLVEIIGRRYLFYPGGIPNGDMAYMLSKAAAESFWLYLIYIIYNLVKYGLAFLVNKSGFKFSKPMIIKDGALLIITSVAVLAILGTRGGKDDYGIIWVLIVIPAILLYLYLTASLIPRLKKQGKTFANFLFRVTLISCCTGIIIIFTYCLICQDYRVFIYTVLILSAVGFDLIIAAIAWIVYNDRYLKEQELTGLKTALGQSSASLDSLRSQINPHFLFNALNTLYGTALQENANRTGDGIQKLGDMMRFMLRENLRDQIPLTRELDYLKNYIDLQKLRTQVSPDIEITTDIAHHGNELQIAPMLLIPFVENAFKHGISLKKSSFIKIILATNGPELLFEVNNSVHKKNIHDPEGGNNGIGLENVKQRLLLLYPGSHHLSIRETDKEFFIHLTINLAQQIIIID